IGVHTPEFSFEEDIDNVRIAVQARGITYPIAIDNNRAIWRGFGNHYWPALYFIAAMGRVRDHLFGEGNYEESESSIRQLLAAAGRDGVIDRESVSIEARGPEVGADWRSVRSPETYIGHQKAENFVSPGGATVNRRRAYSLPPRLRLNQMGTFRRVDSEDRSGRAERRRRPDRLSVPCARSPPHHGAIRAPRTRWFSSVNRWTAARRRPWKRRRGLR